MRAAGGRSTRRVRPGCRPAPSRLVPDLSVAVSDRARVPGLRQPTCSARLASRPVTGGARPQRHVCAGSAHRCGLHLRCPAQPAVVPAIAAVGTPRSAHHARGVDRRTQRAVLAAVCTGTLTPPVRGVLIRSGRLGGIGSRQETYERYVCSRTPCAQRSSCRTSRKVRTVRTHQGSDRGNPKAVTAVNATQERSTATLRRNRRTRRPRADQEGLGCVRRAVHRGRSVRPSRRRRRSRPVRQDPWCDQQPVRQPGRVPGADDGAGALPERLDSGNRVPRSR